MKVFERATSEDKAVPTALSNRLLSLDVYDTPQNLDRRSRCKIAAVQRGENDGQTAKRQLPELFSRSGPQTVRDD
ncbi:MAG TPA: hypothetical protein VNQ79_13235, partial [Blastocatellia bacterium]|nr:hypothetical protein [Blastocatellia bacterium]